MSDQFGNPMWTMYGAGAPCATPSGASVTCAPGGPASLERVRYFQRQLVTAADLNQTQDYHRAQMRRHNRMLHGWGVVCGCEVVPAQGDYLVTVQPGYVLGPQGDEIVVDGPLTVDLRREGLDGNATGSCAEQSDPWCSGVQVARGLGAPLYLAVAYAECPSRPVRLQPAGCGCEDGQCEYSRIRDGFAIRILENLPASHAALANKPPSLVACPRPCPDCITEPWVVLAQITPQGRTITPNDIDNVTYRRYAITFANVWHWCGEKRPEPPVAEHLRVAALRLVEAHGDDTNPDLPAVVELTNPQQPLVYTPTEGTDAIDVRFAMDGGDPIEPNSVIANKTFIVERRNVEGGIDLMFGEVAQVADDTFRWFARDPRDALQAGNLRVTLKGTQPAIQTLAESALDGEATAAFPSGDDDPGGDFVAELTAVLIP
jgi:hypothetical protein